jgi:transcriptional regulator with XRE-family HTH domain
MDRSDSQVEGPNTLIKKTIGRRLRELRESRGMDVAHFAQAVKIQEARLVRIEQGLERMSTAEMIDIARIFGLTAGYFVSGA